MQPMPRTGDLLPLNKTDLQAAREAYEVLLVTPDPEVSMRVNADTGIVRIEYAGVVATLYAGTRLRAADVLLEKISPDALIEGYWRVTEPDELAKALNKSGAH